MPPDRLLEREIGGLVCGIDEVGRGPLAGPVLAAAVILPLDLPLSLLHGLDDSKKLSVARRETLYEIVLAHAAVGVGQSEVWEIDRINILEATMQAMRRAYLALGIDAACALVDGNRVPSLACPVRCVVRGDSSCLSIAAASVVAKVTRDRMMAELASDYPGYGWERNAGYGTAAHLDALRRLGATAHHRRSFAPVAAVLAAGV